MKLLYLLFQHISNIISREYIPLLSITQHKGVNGRIGVIGGDYLYPGAATFCAQSCLRLGADLVNIFCAKEISNVIKSYSAEFMVSPFYRYENEDEDSDVILMTNKLYNIIPNLHSLIIGPGLGRNNKIGNEIINIIQHAITLDKW